MTAGDPGPLTNRAMAFALALRGPGVPWPGLAPGRDLPRPAWRPGAIYPARPGARAG